MVVVSAPGKILLVGGYLVLEEENAGLVVAVDKRFYCECKPSSNAADGEEQRSTIHVESPQFGTNWTYGWKNLRIEQQHQKESDSASPRNVFLEKTLAVIALYLDWPSKGLDLSLRVAADNDFYSLVPHLRERKLQLNQGDDLPPCLSAARDDEGRVYKTGLGSSACLVTAVTGAVLQQQGGGQLDCHQLCSLAQIAHCFAQGKVGSGFDVSAAVYGSHVYRRFPQRLITDLLVQLEQNEDCGMALRELVDASQKSTLGCGVQAPVCAFTDSSLLQVIMADVTGGSESPSMARKVLKWKKENTSTQIPHWGDLAALNPEIVKVLEQIRNTSASASTIEFLAKSHSKDWVSIDPSVGSLLVKLRQGLVSSRRNLKAMGDAAGVPIEPDVATTLCDATGNLPGVVAAVVPGAGGYDAVACVMVNHPSVRQAVAAHWAATTSITVCALTVKGVDYDNGVRIEPGFPV